MGCNHVQTIDGNKLKANPFNYEEEQIIGNKRTFVELEQDSSLSNEIQIDENDLDFYQNFANSFDYFNICWYDPNHSNDCIRFQKAFEKVDVIRGFSIDSIVNFFNNHSNADEFILICPGKNGKQLIPKIHDNKSINSIIIFCWNPDYHKDWAKNFIKIRGIIKTENELFNLLKEINKNHDFPEYNYGFENNKNKISYLIFNYEKIDTNGYTKRLINSFKREYDEYFKMIIQYKNKYKNFFIRMINYFKNNRNEFLKLLESSKSNFILNILGNKGENKLNEFCSFLENLTALHLYIDKCPFFIEILSYEEVLKIIDNTIDSNLLKDNYNHIKNALNDLIISINNKKNILIDEKEKIKELHIFILNYIFKTYESSLYYFKYYIYIRYFMGIDFCLKYFFRIIYRDEINQEKLQIYTHFYSSILLERKFIEFTSDVMRLKTDLNKILISFKEMDKIKHNINIIVFGNEKFKKRIQSIESKMKIYSSIYLTFNKEVKEILASHVKNGYYWKFDFIIIITLNDLVEHYSQLHLISIELGITFAAVIYCETNNNLIYKFPLIYISVIPIFLINNENQLIRLINEWFPNPGYNKVEEEERVHIEICKSLKLIIGEKPINVQNKGWALIEKVQDDIIKNNIFSKVINNVLELGVYFSYIITIYKENSLLDLLFNKYYNLFFISGTSGIGFDILMAKRIIFIYTIEEEEKKNSFYSILNKELRSGEPKRIAPFLVIIALIEREINNKELLSFEGIVHRGTVLTEDLIDKIKPGKIMYNSSFWSCSKDINISKKYIHNSKKANALITINTTGNNIDVDLEKLTNFENEKEVLFIPFTPFKVVEIQKVEIDNKMINVIILQQDINSENICKFENMIPIYSQGELFVNQCKKKYD